MLDHHAVGVAIPLTPTRRLGGQGRPSRRRRAWPICAGAGRGWGSGLGVSRCWSRPARDLPETPPAAAALRRAPPPPPAPPPPKPGEPWPALCIPQLSARSLRGCYSVFTPGALK